MIGVRKTTCSSCTHLESLWAGRTGWLPVALPGWSPFLAAAAAVTLHTTQSLDTSCCVCTCLGHCIAVILMWLGPKGLEQGAWGKAEKFCTRHARICRVMHGVQASSLLLMPCNQAKVSMGTEWINIMSPHACTTTHDPYSRTPYKA